MPTEEAGPTATDPGRIEPERYDLLGVPVSALDLSRAVARIRHLVEHGTGVRAAYVCVRDVNGIMACQGDPELRRIHGEAALVTPDGMPVVWWGRYRGHPSTRRVYGPDLMTEICRASCGWAGATHFLCGGAEGVADLLGRKLRERFPDVSIVGTWTPPYRSLSEDEVRTLAREITLSGAKLVWIGLSSPKQERFMAELAPHLDGCVLIGVGAAFDFLSGLKPQAPRWMQRSGTEWLFRLSTEPGRLWRRYLIGNSLFLWLIVKTLCREALARPSRAVAPP